MKRAALITLMFLMPFNAFSQTYEYVPFPDSGAIWSEVYQPSLDMYGNFPPPIFERFTVNGEDTLINEIEYKKLYLFSDSVFDKSKATYIGGIREDENKRVYFKGNSLHFLKPSFLIIENNGGNVGDEMLLYDFNVNIDDTIRIENLSLFDEILTVSSIDTILIGGSYRKIFSFTRIYWLKWIEGIGSVKGLLFTSGSLPMNGLNGDLICFKQNNETLYFNINYSECFPILNGIETEINDLSDIILYPNPSQDHIRIGFGEHRIKSLLVTDCNGRLCGNYDIQFQTEFILSTEKYQPGIYFYKATSMNGMVHTGKFVVQ
ncbi:MAG: T9SS type A sorting domain-containing protein [Bacteroidales bacterium]|nr:T9SS type A sorting domain-containing protein [Bacteroidales bacterium]